MKFGGFQKTSLVDFPGKISSILFLPGCNLSCPFCHNWRLIVEPNGPFLSEEDALEILRSRRRYVDAVVITGGEPLLYQELPDFLETLKTSGFSVKLDTNGFFPQLLDKCLGHVDYVAVDVKTSLEKYRLLGAADLSGFLESVDLVKGGKVDYEFRNTAVPEIVGKEDIPKMGEVVKGARRFAFQQFIPGDTLDKRFNDVKPFAPAEITKFSEIMKEYVNEVILRI